MSWLGQIRTHRRDEVWCVSLCQTLFPMTMGTQIPVITEKPIVSCGCRKFQLDVMGDHLCTCITPHCGDIKLTTYLSNVTDPVPLVLDLRITRFGSSSDPSLNDHLHYPNDIDKSLD
jgi:hypothetical protein